MSSIRRLAVAGHPRLLEHLQRLDPEDRRLRFCGHVSDAGLVRHCDGVGTAVREGRCAVLGYFVAGVLRGAGELRLCEEEAEMALSVEARYQGLGAGRRLTRHLLLLARRQRVRRVYMYCLAENARMRAIARSLAFVLELRDGEVHGRVLATPWPARGAPTDSRGREGAGRPGRALDGIARLRRNRTPRALLRMPVTGRTPRGRLRRGRAAPEWW